MIPQIKLVVVGEPRKACAVCVDETKMWQNLNTKRETIQFVIAHWLSSGVLSMEMKNSGILQFVDIQANSDDWGSLDVINFWVAV